MEQNFDFQTLRAQAEAVVVAKANAEPQFRAELLTDPKGALQQHFGLNLDSRVELIVHEETPSKFHIVLPFALPAGDELTDEQLEAVAAGSNKIKEAALWWKDAFRTAFQGYGQAWRDFFTPNR